MDLEAQADDDAPVPRTCSRNYLPLHAWAAPAALVFCSVVMLVMIDETEMAPALCWFVRSLPAFSVAAWLPFVLLLDRWACPRLAQRLPKRCGLGGFLVPRVTAVQVCRYEAVCAAWAVLQEPAMWARWGDVCW